MIWAQKLAKANIMPVKVKPGKTVKGIDEGSLDDFCNRMGLETLTHPIIARVSTDAQDIAEWFNTELSGGNVIEKITPETYIKMKEEFEREGTPIHIIVSTQEQIDNPTGIKIPHLSTTETFMVVDGSDPCKAT